MKTHIIFFISVCILTITSSCQEPKEQYFAKTIVKASKYKDFEEFKKIAITPEDMENELAATVISESKTIIQEYKRTYEADYRKLFNKIIKRGDTLGINWDAIKFGNFLYKF